MQNYQNLNAHEVAQELSLVQQELSSWRARDLKLNMARGKPGRAQLDMSSGILTVLTEPEQCVSDGVDARNYGELAGLPAARRYWADVLGCKADQVFVGGAASLNMMFDVVSRAYTHGLLHSPKPWCREEKVKFLCPAPGYDRHFRITESFGAELITVAMTQTGPDMDQVEALVQDPAVKGIWCVPKYSNPDGTIYSAETIRRLAALRPAAADFTIMWDNAYCVHEFASTSKITLPGAGISVMASSEANIQYMQGLLAVQTISYDKMNQLRHVRYLQDKAHTLELMARHGQILRPKFEMVLNMLEQELAPRGLGHWQRPKGGYFVSYYALEGTAKRALELCRQTGVVMTGAGATYPYGIDPRDSNIRIAPSFPPVEELEQAMKIFCLCIRQAALEKLQNS